MMDSVVGDGVMVYGGAHHLEASAFPQSAALAAGYYLIPDESPRTLWLIAAIWTGQLQKEKKAAFDLSDMRKSSPVHTPTEACRASGWTCRNPFAARHSELSE